MDESVMSASHTFTIPVCKDSVIVECPMDMRYSRCLLYGIPVNKSFKRCIKVYLNKAFSFTFTSFVW